MWPFTKKARDRRRSIQQAAKRAREIQRAREVATRSYSAKLPPPDQDSAITTTKESQIFRVLDKQAPEFLSFFRSFGLPQNWFHLSERTLSDAIDALVNPYRHHAWIYMAVRAKARDIMSVPFNLFSGNPDRPEENAQRIPEEDPLQQLFREPNKRMTGEELMEATSIHLDLKGEFIWILGGRNGKYKRGEIPASIMPVWPGNMQHRLDDAKENIVAWELRVERSEPMLYTPEEILHVRFHNPYDAWRGLAPLEAAAMDANIDWKASKFTEALIDNGGEPGGLLSTDIDLKPEQVDEMKGQWSDRHEGAERAGRIAVLTGGLRYQSIGVTQKDMQFSEQRHWSREAILGAFGTPELVVGLAKDVNRTTAQAVKRIYWQDTLVPILQMIQRGIHSKLLKPISLATRTGAGARARAARQLFGRFDLNNVEALKEDFGEKMKWALSLQKLGYPLNAINARLNLDMPEVPWGEEPLSAPNQVPITLLYEQPGLFASRPTEDTDNDDEENKRTVIVAGTGASNREAPATVIPVTAHPIIRRLEVAQRWQRQAFHAAESLLERSVTGYFARTKQAQLNSFAAFRVGQGRNLVDAKEYARLPDNSPLSAEEIEAILLPNARWATEMATAVRETLPAVASGALAFLSEELDGLSVVNPADEWVTNYIGRRLAEMIKLARADRKLIRLAIIDAILQDNDIDIAGIQQRIAEVMGNFPAGRALIIARTEAGQLANSVRYRGMLEEGIQEHEWITMGDELVRPAVGPNGRPVTSNADHRSLDGERRTLGERFSNGLLHPGDPEGDPDEIIGCRCFAGAIRE